MIELLLEAERALASGQDERADDLFRQVADADPRNAIAVVGLARVAVDRGDDLGAYLLTRRALGIDPENDVARRLATRLEIALATRGEPVADPIPPAAPAVEAASAPDPTPEPMPGSTDAPAPWPSTAPAKRRGLLSRLRRGH